MVAGILICDIVLVVLALIFIFGGARKGFLLTLLGLAGVLVSLIVAIFLAQKVADMLYPVFGMGDKINVWAEGIIGGKLNPDGDPANLFAVPIGAAENIQHIVSQALAGIGLPEVIAAPLSETLSQSLANSISGSGAGILSEQSIIQILAPVLTNIIMLIIATTLTFIVLRIVIGILSAIIKKILKSSKTLRGLDRFLGALLGVVKTALIVAVVFTASFFLLGNALDGGAEREGFAGTVNANIEQSTLCRKLYEINPAPKWIAEKINIDAIIDGILNRNQEETPEPTQETDGENEQPEQAALTADCFT